MFNLDIENFENKVIHCETKKEKVRFKIVEFSDLYNSKKVKL